jgi:hypothetical protein
MEADEYQYDAMGLTEADKATIGQQELVDQQARSMMQNPFEQPQYRDIAGSEKPMPVYTGSMAEVLLNNDAVPEFLRKKYWWIFNNDNALTFLNENSKMNKMISFDIAEIDSLNGLASYYDYTFELEQQFGLMRNAFDTKLDRSVGTTGNVKNERIIIQSQFSENRQITESGNGSGPIKEGFFKRLLGRRS